MSIRPLAATAVALVVLAAANQPASAKELVLSSYVPTSHWMIEEGIGKWARQVEEATNGEVTINILDSPLGEASAHFALARDGVADIAVGVPGYTPGRFILPEVAGIPAIGFTGEALSVGLWRTFEQTPGMQEEFSGVKVLSLFTTSPEVPLLTDTRVEKIEDFNGIRVRVAGGMMAKVAEAVGFTPVHAPAGDAYEMLSTGTLDGIIFPISDVKSFRLERLTDYVPNIPGGIAAAPLFVVMNPSSFQGLSEENQKALMRVSGENLARIIGSGWDQKDSEVISLIEEHGGEVYEPDAAFMRNYQGALVPAVKEWMKQVEDKRSVSPESVMKTMRQEAINVEGQHEYAIVHPEKGLAQ